MVLVSERTYFYQDSHPPGPGPAAERKGRGWPPVACRWCVAAVVGVGAVGSPLGVIGGCARDVVYWSQTRPMGKSKAAKATAVPVVKASTKAKARWKTSAVRGCNARSLTVAHRCSLSIGSRRIRVAFSPDGTYLACGRNVGRYSCGTWPRGHLERTVVGRMRPSRACLAERGRARLLAGLHGEIIEVYRLSAQVGCGLVQGAVRLSRRRGRTKTVHTVTIGRSESSMPRIDNYREKCYRGGHRASADRVPARDVVYSAGEEGIIRSWTKKSGELVQYDPCGDDGRCRRENDNCVEPKGVVRPHADRRRLPGTRNLGRAHGVAGELSQHTADVVALAVNSQETSCLQAGTTTRS